MSWTLWRYIFFEVTRLVLVSTAVLVTVIAFAATVKPLADGKLTPGEAITFMLFAVPPMLAYALPFAAGFGTTLAYHRFADDNEVTACQAGGLGHHTILAPALALGATLAVALMLLNDQVIPRFLTRMERLITQDITQVMVRSMASGDSASFDGTEIHADMVVESPREPGSPFERQFLLTGVAAVETDNAGKIVAEVTAQQAWLFLMRAENLPDDLRARYEPDDLIARVHFQEGLAYRDGQLVGLTEFTSPAYVVPSAFEDDPKFLTGSQLAALGEHPERMSWIAASRDELARSLATLRSIRTLARRAEQDGQLVFHAPAGRTLFVHAGSLDWDERGFWTLGPPPGQSVVEVEEQDADGALTRSRATSARLEPQRRKDDDPFAPAPPGVSLFFDLQLDDVLVGPATRDPRLNTSTRVAEVRIERLTVEDDPMPELAALTPRRLLAVAEPYRDQPDIAARAERLEDRIAKLGREVLSKRHERGAMSAACLVMVLTGAVTALRLRTSLPLVVYLWSFFPALATIVLIASGQSATYRHGAVGVPLVWAGVVGLGVYTLFTYARLARR